ncbi:hypothetical protein D8M34_06730 [Microbacterium sp. HSID17254]|nr:hypothetical protein D8M34_06730 [Microbacterium sp. HSID17254]
MHSVRIAEMRLRLDSAVLVHEGTVLWPFAMIWNWMPSWSGPRRSMIARMSFLQAAHVPAVGPDIMR